MAPSSPISHALRFSYLGDAQLKEGCKEVNQCAQNFNFFCGSSPKEAQADRIGKSV